MFHIPYRTYMKEDETVCIFYVLSAIAFVFYVIWSIADFADANGWIMLAKMAGDGKGGAAFFSFFTALFSTGIYFLTALNLFYFCKREDTE